MSLDDTSTAYVTPPELDLPETTPDLAAATAFEAYTPIALATRHNGWTAQRQRLFLQTLAESGRVTVAAHAAGMSLRSAYWLRNHPNGTAFARAWDQALLLAADLLTALAFERAIVGSQRVIRRDGRVVAEITEPNDRMLMFLINRFEPHRFGPTAATPRFADGRIAAARTALPDALAALTDVEDDDHPG